MKYQLPKEKRVLITNPSKGKLEIIIGSIGIAGGGLLAFGGLIDTLHSIALKEDNIDVGYFALGTSIALISCGIYALGKFKQWYHKD